MKIIKKVALYIKGFIIMQKIKRNYRRYKRKHSKEEADKWLLKIVAQSIIAVAVTEVIKDIVKNNEEKK